MDKVFNLSDKPDINPLDKLTQQHSLPFDYFKDLFLVYPEFGYDRYTCQFIVNHKNDIIILPSILK